MVGGHRVRNRATNLYRADLPEVATQMIDTALRATTFALHQLTVVLGIALLPLALLTRQAGIHLPFQRAIETTEQAYQRTAGR